MGASTGKILGLLITDIVKGVHLAAALAWPIAYLIVAAWLKNDAYRIDVPWLFFILSVLILAVITLLTAVYHTFIAARANPVNALREE